MIKKIMKEEWWKNFKVKKWRRNVKKKNSKVEIANWLSKNKRKLTKNQQNISDNTGMWIGNEKDDNKSNN